MRGNRANSVKTVASAGELPADGGPGKLAIVDDGIGPAVIYIWDIGSAAWILSNSGGDLSGPASSTDDAIARYDGTTGKLLKDSSKSLLLDNGRVVFDTTSRIADIPLFMFRNNAADVFFFSVNTGTGVVGVMKGDATDTDALFLVDAFDNTGKATLSVGLGGTGAISIITDIAGASAKIENTLIAPFIIGNNAGLLRLETLSDHQFDLPSNDGTDKVAVRDSDDAEVAIIDSNGNLSGNNLSGTNTGDEVAATEGTAGVAELATQAETDAGTDDATIVTPLKLANIPKTIRFGWAVPDTDNAVATVHSVKSVLGARLSAVTVDAVPTTQNHVDSNTSMILVEITAMTSAGTLQLTGTSFDTDTGAESPADTEDIVIAATGWFESIKHWRGTVVLSSVGGLDVILDSFLWDPILFEKDVVLSSIQVQYKSTAVANSSRIVLQRFNPSSGFTTLLDETITDITSVTDGSHHLTSLSEAITESSGDRLYMFTETKRVTDYRFEVHGSEA